VPAYKIQTGAFCDRSSGETAASMCCSKPESKRRDQTMTLW
jgi:hypothetical protein